KQAKGDCVKHFKQLGRGGRVLVALVVAGAVFGLATVVQAAIPSSGGVLTACYQTSASGTPKGTMRAIDAESGEFCRFNEKPVQLATTGFVASQSNIYYGSGEVDNTSAGGTVASVDVPAGNYAVSATGWAAGL